MDIDGASGADRSLVVRPVRRLVGPFVARALAAVLDSPPLGVEDVLDQSPVHGAPPDPHEALLIASRN